MTHVDVLVAYATTEGQTETVARRVADRLIAADCDVELVRLSKRGTDEDAPDPAADDAPKSREAVAELADSMTAKTGWHPDEVGTFAGALRYSAYGPLKRFVMKRIARRYEGGTDTGRDYEYTDWDAVDAASTGSERVVSGG